MDRIRASEERARTLLPAPVYDYVAGGAGSESGLAAAETAWAEHWLLPRVLRGTGDLPSTGVELLGDHLRTPVLLAPVAAHRMVHPDGELATARAAAAAGTIFCVSTRATADLADVAAAAPGAPRWFQCYVSDDRDRTARVLARAGEHGYRAVALTVDQPVTGRREREERHGPVRMPEGTAVTDHLGAGGTEPATSGIVGYGADLGWEDVAWVGEASGLPVVVKGILHPDDARLAVEHGAAAIIVSGHGARQLNGALPSARALAPVVAAVGGRVPVLVDGGIRSGEDVVRALALGARAVLVGRPYAWALAADGETGVRELLAALTEDVARTLALVGATDVGDVGADLLAPR